MGWNFYNASGELQINDGGVQADSAVFTGNVDLGSNLLVGNAGSTGIAISANGEVTMAAQPAVCAYNAALITNVTGNSTEYTMVYATEVYDQNADFDATSTFTAPVTGRYRATARSGVTGVTTAGDYMLFTMVTSNRSHRLQWEATNNMPVASSTWELNALVDMDAADTLYTKIDVRGESGDVVDIMGGSTLDTAIYIELVA